MRNKSNISCKVPFIFEKNIGQHYEDVKFILKKSNMTTFFTQDEVVLALSKPNTVKQSEIDKSKPIEYEVNVLRINLENSNKNTEVIGLDEFNCKINYFKGKNIDDWIVDIPIYERVLYKEIYPGIDLLYYENEGILEHDFIVKPDADLGNIKIRFEGYEKLELDEDGNLLIYINDEIVQMVKPRVYQEVGENQEEVESSFVISEDKVSFIVSDYDKNNVLIIDPGLLYSSYLGGSSSDFGKGIAIDDNQNAYIVGDTASMDFPTVPNAYQSILKGGQDVFLSKIDTTQSGSSSLIYSTYLGGNSNVDYSYGVAVDNNQNAYIVGYTGSSDFPTKNAYQITLSGRYDAFLSKIDTTLSGTNGLIYSTYLGGSNDDYGYGVAVDNNQNAYIVGSTASMDFPTVPNAYQNTLRGPQNAFLSKIDTTESGTNSLIYSTYIGGNGYDSGHGVTVDSNQNAYITGITNSSDFPTVSNAYQNTLKGVNNVFLSKIDTTESGINGLIYSTYLGGSSSEIGNGVAVDNNQNAYITGYTNSDNFPIKNAYQSTFQGGYDIFSSKYDVFLSKINTTESGINSLIYSTYLGGSDYDYGYGVAVDNNENAYIIGHTSSNNFPITSNAYQNTLKGFINIFLSKIDTTQNGINSLIYSTYLGGSISNYGYGVAVDSNQNAYITGATNSSDFPTTTNAYQNTRKGGTDAFLAKLSTPISSNKFADKNFVNLRDAITYTVCITNTLATTMFNLLFIDTIPTGTVFTQDSLYINGVNVPGENTNPPGISIPDINPGQLSTITFSVNVTNTIPFTNPINNQGSFYFEMIQTSGITVPGFSETNIFTTTVSTAIIKSSKLVDKDFADIGTTLNYTVTIINVGSTTADNIVFIDTIPSGTSFVGGSLTQDTVSIPNSPNPPGVTLPNSLGPNSISTVNFSVVVNTIPTINPILNSATQIYNFIVDSTTTPNIIENGFSNTNIVSTQVSNANLGNINFLANKDYATCGDTVIYTVILHNTGSTTAQNIVLIDTIPNGMSFILNSINVNGTTLSGYNPETGISIPDMSAGNTTTVTYKMNITC